MPTGPQSLAPSMVPVQRSSTIDLITTQLRNAIYEGLLMPGGQIHEAVVAKQLGVSRGSLRESAQRLVQDGLLVANPGQGLTVATVGIEDLDNLYATRLVVEGAAIRQLAERAQAGERRRLLAPAARVLDRLTHLAETPATADVPRAIGDADLDFHFESVKAAGNLRLSRYMTTLVMETRLASLGNPGGYVIRTDVHEVHRERLDLVLAGEADAAVDALRHHFRDTVDRLTGALRRPVATAVVDIGQGGQELGPIIG